VSRWAYIWSKVGSMFWGCGGCGDLSGAKRDRWSEAAGCAGTGGVWRAAASQASVEVEKTWGSGAAWSAESGSVSRAQRDVVQVQEAR
jgi:hypothetical protein